VAEPLPAFTPYISKANIQYNYDFRGAAWQLPYAAGAAGAVYPTFATALARSANRSLGVFPVDYSIDHRSIPRLSAADVLGGKLEPGALRGKQVIIGATSQQLGDMIFFPGHGMLGGLYLHVLGAETLKAGTPAYLGWFLPWLAFSVIALAAMHLAPRRSAIGLLAGGIALALLLPLPLERALLFVDVVPALALLSILAARLGWLSLRQTAIDKARTHPLSGLPSLNMLREEAGGAARPLIVARITNYAEITASIPVDWQKQLVGQIAGRLALGSSGRKLYQGDEGIFAWFADDEMAISLEDHLGAMHNIFRSPVRVGETTIDLNVTFGVESASERSTENRIGSAILAAEEAAAEGQRWKLYDAERLKEAPWRLSLLSQLEQAMDGGGLWVAYQPQIEVRSGRLIGAEALVRWTHPEKGPISPVDFIPIAESSGRIRSLTEFVLDHALATAAAVSEWQPDFCIAVNLSARLIDEPDLCEMVSTLLAKHGVRANRLTLEVTETAALGTTDQHVARLAELRRLGVCLAIDDYGTGLSTLDYVRRLEADEIKIDRSFVQALRTSQDDRVIVESTIKLAHSLGHQVTAEGIEDQDTLTLLDQMGCDRAQGFFIARPMAWDALLQVVQFGGSSSTMSG
jgi:EAL domain-containing protein (putative c-di-GMP-specific phosphodiesterase class I)